MRVETGQPETHPTPLPLQDTGPGISALAEVTATGQSGVQGSVMPTVEMNLSQQHQGEADVRAAQAAGQAAETDRRHHYSLDVLPQGASYGDPVDLPPVDSAGQAPLWGPFGDLQPPSGTFT